MKRFLLTSLAVVWIASTVFAGQWIQNGDAWMYQNDDESFVMSEQKKIDGKYYYFDETGCVLTGYQMIDNDFYVFNNDGTPKTDPIVYDGVTYNVSSKGKINNMNAVIFEKIKDSAFITGTGALAGDIAYAQKVLATYPISKKTLRIVLENKGITSDKVDYVVANINADWKNQAVKCAKKFREYRKYNRKGLISILMGEGFTEEEAKYGVEGALASSSGGVDVSDSDTQQDIAKYIAEMRALAVQVQ